MWRWMPLRASVSMTGPTSTERRSGLPTASSRMAPRSIVSTWSALSSCTHSTRSAEQRWPAESKAELNTSNTTCSDSADESTTIAFWPPVSAISGMVWPSSSRRSASVRAMMRATSVEPVNITPRTAGLATSWAPTVSPRPGSSCTAPAGTPAARKMATACAAINGVCSAGLATTVLPAASAAATWPVKMASGKFHGLMHSTVPSGRCVSLLNSRSAWSA
ncbi:hypothetical protein D3C72_1076340 [compost metagenome]